VDWLDFYPPVALLQSIPDQARVVAIANDKFVAILHVRIFKRNLAHNTFEHCVTISSLEQSFLLLSCLGLGLKLHGIKLLGKLIGSWLLQLKLHELAGILAHICMLHLTWVCESLLLTIGLLQLTQLRKVLRHRMYEWIWWHLHLSSIDLYRPSSVLLLLLLLLHVTLALSDVYHLLLHESRADQLVMLVHQLTHGLRHCIAVGHQPVMFATSFLRRSAGLLVVAL